MNLAVIDAGTNTFHLLIVDQKFQEVYRKRIFVQLADEGIETIGPGAYQRGLDAFEFFRSVLEKYNVDELKAFGTAALRRASNGDAFRREIFENTGIKLQVIDGYEEARLICKGVRQIADLNETPALIMDIGGGSVEFVVTNKNDILWSQSFPVGVAVLHKAFHKSDPISDEEVLAINDHLAHVFQPLLKVLETHKPSLLIGASGTFDVLEVMLGLPSEEKPYTEVPLEHFPLLVKKLLKQTLNERINDPTIPNERAELIIVAILLIDFVLKSSNIEILAVSAFAMKEGVISEMIDNKTSI